MLHAGRVPAPAVVDALQRRAGNAAVAGAIAAVQRKASCAPEAVDRETYLSRGGPRDGFGLTRLSGSSLEGDPNFHPVVAHPKIPGKFAIAANVPKLGTIPSMYNKAEAFAGEQGPRLTQAKDQPTNACGDEVPRRWVVTKDGSEKMAQAEREHCADFQRAYDLTLGRFAKAAASFRGRAFASPAAAELTLGKKSGVEPKAWGDKWEAMASRTLERDDPASGEHVPRVPAKDQFVPRANPCAGRVINVTAAAFSDLGTRKPDDLFR
jgi:hypothetical protein